MYVCLKSCLLPNALYFLNNIIIKLITNILEKKGICFLWGYLLKMKIFLINRSLEVPLKYSFIKENICMFKSTYIFLLPSALNF